VLLVVVVIVAAGIGGTSHFGGARWYPHLGGKGPTALGTRKTLVPTAPPPTRRPPTHNSGGVPWWIIALVAAAVVVAIAAFLLRLWRRRRMPSAPELHASSVQATQPLAPEPEAEPETLLTGIEIALQALDEQREPGDAVVRAWLGLQETAEESGIVRLASETPTEFTSRILNGAFADDRALRTLLRLYLRTRFGDHPVTAEDVASVRDALKKLVSNWHAANAATTTGGR
jgi:Domain of unknown function (DUF4129)